MRDTTQHQLPKNLHFSSSAEKNTLTVVKTERVATLYGRNGKAHARMIQLSPKFAGVVSPRGAKIGTRLEIEFEIPAFGKVTVLRLPGIVTERHLTENGYHLTIQFEKIDNRSLSAIQDFIAYKERLHQANLRHTISIPPITE